MEMIGENFPVFMFLSVGALALFSFIAVATWADNRRKEREAFYKSETIKKIAESQSGGGAAALEYMREQGRLSAQRQAEGLKLGGLVATAVGAALMVFLRGQEKGSEYLVGLMPMAVGIALLLYIYVLAPKK